ncbi:accessory Sec system protein Asp2 [Abyssicoccus albus]|uniref:Accessory secretory protein Asp2 n=1 Tax=Abyssicoccus albus TaxID=1817405 RepID=A0A3N5BG41_9BACL|nr:accessory Sec system protein Asp2 [Abyssicoccus albus]RPF56704.1 accessory secretory protein Asp2 [Abyssicoccus albus]
MKKIFKVLQIGHTSYQSYFEDQSKYYWLFVKAETLVSEDLISNIQPFLKKAKAFDLILIENHLNDEIFKVIKNLIKPYNTYVHNDYWNDYKDLQLTYDMFIRSIEYNGFDEYIEKIKSIAYVGQYGDKIHPKGLIVNKNFQGNVQYFGNKEVILEGNFGDELTQVATWRYNIFYEKDRVLEIWPEIKIEGDLEVYLHFYYISGGSIDSIEYDFKVLLNDLNEPLRFERQDHEAYFALSLEVVGQGKVSVGPIHRRWSRLEFGEFLLGGKRHHDSRGEEFISYFHPGDLKPPLNVYFSGYRSAEGFEGYFLMNLFKAPFLLIADPRLEGGSFYLGSEEYEQTIINTIRNTLNHLGFKENEVILSGLSMGSFGALYYGAQLKPAAIIAGKPLINIGTVAENMKILRPNDFGTANDILLSLTGGMSVNHIEQLNDRFWNVLEQSDLKYTTIAISYMINDDYDLYAFDNLLNLLSSRQIKVISRGIAGRHNDDSSTINQWFIHFYNIMLETKFGRQPYDR